MSDLRHLKLKDRFGTHELMWCNKHQEVGKRWADGSFNCWWEDVVESSGNHEPSDLVPLLSVFPKRGPLVEHE